MDRIAVKANSHDEVNSMRRRRAGFLRRHTWLTLFVVIVVCQILRGDTHPNALVQRFIDGVRDDDNGAGITGRSFLALAADAIKGIPESQLCRNAIQAKDISLSLLYGGQYMVMGGVDDLQAAESQADTKARAAWFVGFMEGATRIPMPLWWKETLLSAENAAGAVRGQSLWFRDLEDNVQKQEGRKYETMLDGSVQITCDSHQVALSDAVLQPIGLSVSGSINFGDVIDATCDDDTLWLVVASETSCSVVCVDRIRGSVQWHRKAWLAVPTPAGSSGMARGVFLASLVRSDHDIVVFGASHDGLYANAFDSMTGVPRWRFFTGRRE